MRGSANVYRDDAIAVVLASCRADGFAHVPSFKWLITTLLSVAALHSKHGPDVASLLLEVRSPHRHASPRIATHRHASPRIATHRHSSHPPTCPPTCLSLALSRARVGQVTLRVPTVRAFASERCLQWIVKCVDSADSASKVASADSAAGATSGGGGASAPSAADGSSETPSDATLLAASYILGEHAWLLPDERQRVALSALLSPRIASLSSPGAAVVQSSCVQSAVRVLTQLTAPSAGEDATSSGTADAALLGGVGPMLLPFCTSVHPEVLERAKGAHAIVALLAGSDGAEGSSNTGGSSPSRRVDLRRALSTRLSAELRAIAPKAQRKVRPPAGLDLKARLYTATAEDWAVLRVPAEGRSGTGSSATGSSTSQNGTAGGELAAQALAPRSVTSGPYYLQSETRATPSDERAASCGRAVSNAALAADGTAGGGGASDLGFGYEDDRGDAVVDLDEAMPDGADESDDEDKACKAPASGPGDGSDAGAQGAMVSDLLGTAASLGAPEGSTGSGRRRRRKHRSGLS